ncbi:hypothetical protein F5887DRAFT_920043 [Amanita rubescens]|nr:hypothetical protein F5887DRAFT_920043 [Amanita rubescens]
MSTTRKRDFEEFQIDFNLIDEEDDVLSSGSDEPPLDMMLIAQQLAAAKEKRREEKEVKLLKAAEKQLDQEDNGEKRVCHSSCQYYLEEDLNPCSEKLYEKFLIDYATCEDKIRSLWVQLFEEHEKLHVIERALHEKHEKAATRHEGQEIEALSKIHTAHEEKKRIIDQLLAS